MRKIISLVLSLVLLITLMPTTVSAKADKMNLIKTEDQFQQLKEKYGFEESNINNIPNKDILEFDSLEEFEEFIIELKKPQKFSQDIYISNSFSSLSRASKKYNGSHVINSWAPFSGWGMTGLACWRNIAFEYQYKFVDGNPRFTSVSNISSYLTGINVTWWQQKSKSHNFETTTNTDDTVVIKVKGNFVLGVAVKGFNVGVTIPGSWEGSLTLK